MGEETLDSSMTDAMKASQEAQEMATASLQKLSSQYGMDNVSGTDAAKVLQQYDERHKEAMKLIRKNYGDDIRGFNRFMLAYGAKMEDERRSIAKMCGAEMRHGLGIAVKTDTEKRFADIEHRDMLDGASVTAGQAVSNEEASEAFHSRLDEIDSEAEEAKNRAKQDYEKAIAQEGADKARLETEYKAKIAAIDSATSISRGATAGESVDALKKIKGMESSNAASKAKPLRDDFRNIFIQRLKAEGSGCLGHSPEIAMANALQATRNGVIGYFTNRIKSGQVAAVLTTLDELERLGDKDFEASKKKSPTGVYDPSAYGFLRKSDIFALRKAVKAQLEEMRHDKLTMESIANANDNAALKVSVYNAQRLIDQLYSKGEVVKPEEEKVLAKNIGEILQCIDAIYARNPKVVGAHVNTIKNYYRREQARYVKAMGEASNCKNEEEFRRMLRLLDSTTEPTQKINVPLLDSEGNVKEQEIEMDTHKAFLTTYSLARKAGYFKSGEFAISARRHNDPALRASRIQSAINSFFDTSKSGKTATFAGVVLDVNKDGSIGIVNTKKETVGELDDALKGDVLWFFDSNLKIPYEVIRSVVNRLDDFCVRSMVTPTDDQLKEELENAYNAAVEAHDNKAFNANFLNALSGNINAKFDPQENYRRYADDQLEVELRRRRGEQVDPALLERVENGRIRADFKVIEASVVPTANMYKKSIMRGTDTKDDNDFMAIAEE